MMFPLWFSLSTRYVAIFAPISQLLVRISAVSRSLYSESIPITGMPASFAAVSEEVSELACPMATTMRSTFFDT